MKRYVVTEGPSDVARIEEILRSASLADVNVVSAGGKSSVVSFAKSIAISRDAAVAVVMDAETSQETLIREQEANFDDLMRSVSPSARVQLFLAIPNLEDALSQDGSSSRAFSKRLTAFLKRPSSGPNGSRKSAA